MNIFKLKLLSLQLGKTNTSFLSNTQPILENTFLKSSWYRRLRSIPHSLTYI